MTHSGQACVSELQNFAAIEAAPPVANCTKKPIELTRLQQRRSLTAGKVFRPDRTKSFHVKHFGTIGAPG
jgi:hypothetical protein